MDIEELNRVIDTLVINEGIENVVAAVAQAAVNQVERAASMGHDTAELMDIATSLTEAVTLTES